MTTYEGSLESPRLAPPWLLGKTMPNELLHLHSAFEVRAVAEDKRSIDVIASTSAIDSYGEILLQDWDLKRYAANPVVLYGHDSWSLPIGHASDVRVDKATGALVATLHFVDEKANPRAEQVWQGIKQGSLRAVSVGFVPHNVPKAIELGDKTVIALSGNELFEISVVPIPANPEAVTLSMRSFINRTLIKPGGSTPAAPAAAVAAAPMPTLAPTAAPSPTPPPKDTMTTKAINVALALSADAEEFAALTAITALKACEREILAVTGKSSIAEALGAVTALKESNASMVAQNAELTKAAESRDREDLIRAGVAAKKLSPAQVASLSEKSLEFVRGFVEMTHPNPTLANNYNEPEHTRTTQLEWNGKKWDELAPNEKHDLYHENRELYDVMRDGDASKRKRAA